MSQDNREVLITLLEELAVLAVGADAAKKEGLAMVTASLRRIKAACREHGFQAVEEVFDPILGAAEGQGSLTSQEFKEALSCWISLTRSVLNDKDAFLGAVARFQKIFPPCPSYSRDGKFCVSTSDEFVPRVPELDLSEGSEILLEFVTESLDHLESAEESLLNLENSPDNPDELNKIFREFHTIKGVSSFLNLEDIRVLSHDTETLMDLVRQGALVLDEKVSASVFLSIDFLRKLLGLLRQQVRDGGVLKSPYLDITPAIAGLRGLIAGVSSGTPGGRVKKLGEVLVEKEIISESELLSALEEQKLLEPDKKIGEILVEIGAATKTQIGRGLREQRAVCAAAESVKITVRKLDDLVDVMGELVITGTQIIHHPDVLASANERLHKDVGQLDRIIRDIQNISMAIRLVPIRPLFQRMTRLIRDLSLKADKKIDVGISGEDTEIDKNVIELISDPLVHMVRNAVDHGIEPQAARLARGKPEAGRIELHAYHKGGNIMVEVKDDGAGLDRDKILARAKERGLLRGEEAYSDDRIYRFIFEPGFSTAEKITDISGRGVGMDVVKRNIDQLQGRIDIESGSGRGTRFSLRLPLTLAIIEGIVVRVRRERYILPIFVIEEFISFRHNDLITVAESEEMIKIHGKLSTIVWLGRFLGGASAEDAGVRELTGCLVNTDHGQVCLVIDELIEQQQIVIKSLGGYLKDAKGLAGATILGDGRVGLILDVNAIAGLVKNKEVFPLQD